MKIVDLFRLVDIILEKMSDASDDSNAAGQGQNVYGNQAGAYNKGGATRLTANDQQQAKGNQCQC